MAPSPSKESQAIFTTPPPQPKEKKQGQLTSDEVQHYFKKVYLIQSDWIYFQTIVFMRKAPSNSNNIVKCNKILYIQGLPIRLG